MPRLGLHVLVALLAILVAPYPAAAQDVIALSVASMKARERTESAEGHKTAELDIRLGEFSASLFAKWSRAHLDRQIEVRVDGMPVGKPARLLKPVTGGVLVVQAFSLEAAEKLAARLDQAGLVIAVTTVP